MSEDDPNERKPFPHADLTFYVIGTVVAAPLAKIGWDGLVAGDYVRGVAALLAAVVAAGGAFSFKYWESHLEEPTRRVLHDLANNKTILASLTLIAVAYFGIFIPDLVRRFEPIIPKGTPAPLSLSTPLATGSGGQQPPTPVQAAPVVAPLSPEEQQKRNRTFLVETRSKLELAARDATGTPVRVEFNNNGSLEILTVTDGQTEYKLQVAIAGSMGAWIFPASSSPKPLLFSKTLEHGKPIDIRNIRPSKTQDVMQIGEHAFARLPDGKLLQLILVGVQWYREGDDTDELRFKYKIHSADDFLIDSL